ncbi:MAG: NADH:flavin oxidoreductase/NADH oxidase [Desulfobulbus sp.]|nr:NADH:flavin oxidoreductase/NADH oxidase [Desulfobulbus sp.]
MSTLFSPFTLRSVTIKNRIFVSPMCQYSSEDGLVNNWHLVHYGCRAVGGAGLVMVEATTVSPEGRISPADNGIWNDAHVAAFAPIVKFIAEQGAVPGIQLAHAGRKGSCALPWQGGKPVGEGDGGWQTVAPSPFPFLEEAPQPKEASKDDLQAIVAKFRQAACKALAAGFQVVEIHMAHGYLLHEFLSPIANKRQDEYGGGLDNRLRFPLQVAEAVRAEWPDNLPLFVRLSVTDYVENGWDLEQSLVLIRRLKALGVDFIDCSSGFIAPHDHVPFGPGFQVPYAARIKAETGIATGSVGCITDPAQAEQIVATGQADAVLLGREFLRDPYWPLHAAKALGADVSWPNQYLRAK